MVICGCGREFLVEYALRNHRRGCDGKRDEPSVSASIRQYNTLVRLGAKHGVMLFRLMEERGVGTPKAMVELLIEEESDA